MKELKKIKRISVGSALFILAVIVGFLTYERSEHNYTMNVSTTLENLTTSDYIISIKDIEQPGVILVDIRSPFEFEKGHLDKAINIPTPDILKEKNQAIFKEWKESSKVAVLYGKDIEEANIPFLFLYQLGYDNLKLLNAENTFLQNELVTRPSDIEKPKANIKAFIDESIEKSKIKVVEKVKVVVPKKIIPVKKVIPVKKKKKRPVEGGC